MARRRRQLAGCVVLGEVERSKRLTLKGAEIVPQVSTWPRSSQSVFVPDVLENRNKVAEVARVVGDWYDRVTCY
jgi:hypothetical protein